MFDGGTEIDTIYMRGAITDYNITKTSATDYAISVRSGSMVSSSETATFRNIEKLAFGGIEGDAAIAANLANAIDLSSLVIPSPFADNLSAPTAFDWTVNGLAGADTLTGGAGNDNINGGTENDTIFGNVGNDTIDGQAGNDLLDGGTGNDTLLGGNDKDTIAGGAIPRPDDRAETLRGNVQRLLEARVGPGRAIVEVNVDADMDSQTISERVIDPDSRVAISSESEQNQESSKGTNAGVTVASNLPDGAAGGSGESSRSSSRSSERQNFDVSETKRERVVQPGQVRRISVAVIVDGITGTATDGTQNWTPRPPEEMDTLRMLVQSAIG